MVPAVDQRLQQPAQGGTRHQPGIAFGGQPSAQGFGGSPISHPLGQVVGLEEVVLHELAQAGADGVFAPGDDGGVGDGDAQRVFEQGGHREPVGQTANHGRLGGSLHIAGPAVAVGEQPHHHK